MICGENFLCGSAIYRNVSTCLDTAAHGETGYEEKLVQSSFKYEKQNLIVLFKNL